MFRNWGFLLGEIWILIALAAVLGLFVGWLVFGRRASAPAEMGNKLTEDRLRADLETCRRDSMTKDVQIAETAAALEDLRALNLAAQAEEDTDDVADAEAAPLGNDGADAPVAGGAVAGDDLPDDVVAALAAKDDQIAVLEADLEELRAELETDASAIEAKFEEMMGEAAEKDAEIERLSDALAAVDPVQVEQTTAALRAELEDCHNTIAKRNARIKRLIGRVEEITQAAEAAAASKDTASDESPSDGDNTPAPAPAEAQDDPLIAPSDEVSEQGDTAPVQDDAAPETAGIADTDADAGTDADMDKDPEPIPVPNDVADETDAEPESEPVVDLPPTRPLGFNFPNPEGPDDLKRIKGIGPQIETLCHSLGFFHFSQIAAWTDAEIAWMDSNLEGFNGRVSRDGWVGQARILASGGTTEFASRVDQGDLY